MIVLILRTAPRIILCVLFPQTLLMVKKTTLNLKVHIAFWNA